jgi:hypothetical protein
MSPAKFVAHNAGILFGRMGGYYSNANIRTPGHSLRLIDGTLPSQVVEPKCGVPGQLIGGVEPPTLSLTHNVDV